MKKLILLLVFSLLCSTLFGQQEEIEKLIGEGVYFHDKGDYKSAIDKYDQVLQLDEDNLLALAEKAMSLMYLQKYDDAIKNCKRAIEKHQGDDGLKLVYVTCGNAYDALKETDKSLEMYDEGLKLFPDFFLLYFNKAITLSNIERYEEAIICSQKSVSFNPQHASSHNSLGRLLCVSENRIPAILALSRFLILEPQTNRAKDNLELLQYVMKANVEKTGKNTINVKINPNMLSDTTEDGKIKENNFATTDLLLTMETALDYDKKPKKKTEVKKFIEKIELVCSSLKESKNENYGFYWDYYVPYFIEMQDGKFIKTFAHIAFATSGYPDVDKWLKKHEKDINNFYEWSSNFNWQQNGK